MGRHRPARLHALLHRLPWVPPPARRRAPDHPPAAAGRPGAARRLRYERPAAAYPHPLAGAAAPDPGAAGIPRVPARPAAAGRARRLPAGPARPEPARGGRCLVRQLAGPPGPVTGHDRGAVGAADRRHPQRPRGRGLPRARRQGRAHRPAGAGRRRGHRLGGGAPPAAARGGGGLGARRRRRGRADRREGPYDRPDSHRVAGGHRQRHARRRLGGARRATAGGGRPAARGRGGGSGTVRRPRLVTDRQRPYDLRPAGAGGALPGRGGLPRPVGLRPDGLQRDRRVGGRSSRARGRAVPGDLPVGRGRLDRPARR